MKKGLFGSHFQVTAHHYHQGARNLGQSHQIPSQERWSVNRQTSPNLKLLTHGPTPQTDLSLSFNPWPNPQTDASHPPKKILNSCAIGQPMLDKFLRETPYSGDSSVSSWQLKHTNTRFCWVADHRSTKPYSSAISLELPTWKQPDSKSQKWDTREYFSTEICKTFKNTLRTSNAYCFCGWWLEGITVFQKFF